MTELLVLQTDSFDSIYMFNSMLWLFWTLRCVASMFDKGQEANGMCVYPGKSVSSVGVGIG